jgi:hypothetical protein
VAHLNAALDFLWDADRFHGAWPHWIHGNTGSVIPFSAYDDGGDLVETALLCKALICTREYFKDGNAKEQILAQKADVLWKGGSGIGTPRARKFCIGIGSRIANGK